ncbi:MAG: hypothetical protein DRP85_08085 [Candidatus Makaraimicrobium thalassicum]|nr:MAG: hypothetical protein DRP85_08085 [Candidatus Omnitrophota bacterium]
MVVFLVQIVVLAGAIVAASVALLWKDLLASVILLAIMSLLLSAEFYILQAPDVAIAEAAIGAGLTTAIYVMTINKTSRWDDERKKH